MTLFEAIAQAKLVRDALAAGQPLTAWKLTLPLQEFLADAGMSFGIQAKKNDAKEVAELKCLLEECGTIADQLQAQPGAAGVEMAKFGDGVLLGRLIELFKLLLPIFAPIFLDQP